jgi:NADH:ubiquinone oxidoreductase subunit 4 (subunit M)
MMSGVRGFRGWLSLAFVAVAPPVRVITGAGFVSLSAYSVLRWCGAVLPHGASWAASTLSVGGIALAAYSAARLLRETDLRAVVADTTSIQFGFLLIGLGSSTAIGIEGSVMLLLSQALAATILALCLGFFEQQAGDADAHRFRGLARASPTIAWACGVGFAAAAALPGSASFLGYLLALVGAFPSRPWLAVLGLAAGSVAAVAHVRLFRRLFGGELSPSWHRNRRLEAHGGRFARPGRQQVLALIAVSAVSLGLGFSPRLLLRATDRAAYDFSWRLNRLGPAGIATKKLPLRAPNGTMASELQASVLSPFPGGRWTRLWTEARAERNRR